MFEEMTYDNILNAMLDRVATNVDKREGSIIFDALAPAAYKLAEQYFNLSQYVDLFFADTAVGEFLDRKVADHGIMRKPAANAVRQVETSGAVEIGTRWGIALDTPIIEYNGEGNMISISSIPYTITEMLKTNVYSAICSYAGELGNIYVGSLENIDNVSGVTATLTNVITAGADKETDDDLRERFRIYIINPSQDGNNAQYKKWAIEYPGIAAAKVFPLWNGGNTVKIAIADALYTPAENTLVNEFQSYIDPGAEGKGNGKAPIGSKVTVTGGTLKDINVVANVILAEGYTEPTGAAEAISNYLKSIVFDKNSVSFMRIAGALLDCPSINDINNLTINSGTIDISVVGEEIAVLAELSLTVVSG